MSNEELVSLSAVELRRRIGTKEVSPVELLDACLDRIEEVNPAVNAVTAMCVKRARQEAKAAEAAARRGEDLPPLHGLPTGIKDLEETKDLLTTYGSPLYRDFVPTWDNVMVGRVRAAGAVVVGKTNVPEFGAGANSRNPVWGATGNPFDPRLNPGGSSGGSAVALATDMLPVCTGSDTGGSLRIPAAMCGVVGFRPSPGMVAVERRGMGWTPISVLGPMGRTVADTCLLYATQVGQHDTDPLSFPIDGAVFAEPWPVDLGSLRVAWSEDFGGVPVEKGIRRTMRAKIKAMKHLFRSLDEVKMDFGEADRCFDVVRAVSFVARYREAYEKNRELLGPNIRANYEIGANMTLADFAWAHAEQTRIFRKFQETLPGLRLGAGADGRRHAVPLDAALCRRDERQEAAQLLPLAGADLLDHAGHQPGALPALRRRPRGHAVRPAGDRPLPRRRRGARRGARHGAGIQAHPRPGTAAARDRQAAQALARA